MELISQHTKKIMEGCKIRAREAGLVFENETLEYIISNRDMIELSPKVMIPTLYDYWVNDVEVLKKKGQYKLYPGNPYETVINSRPAISFYNEDNPDWLNIMIFYHVLAHIDFFQNNIMFKNTWNDDFVGQALADKRLITSLRNEYGRWVDYVIEFSRSIDNISSYFQQLSDSNTNPEKELNGMLDYYFNYFLQQKLNISSHELFSEIERYNRILDKGSELTKSIFFAEVKTKHPELQAMYKKFIEKQKKEKKSDLLGFISENSPFLKKESNKWMKSVINIIRSTGLYFEPQIRTKICNEGWASYWHDELFRRDNRIKGHEIAFAKINAQVTSVSRVGLNPYAIGLRLVRYVKELAEKGKMDIRFQKLQNAEKREEYDIKSDDGTEAIFNLRSNFSDFTLINTFIDQDFIDKHELFVVGKRLNQQKNVFEYYVKSRKAEDYKQMLIDSLYHPPFIEIDQKKSNDDTLYLVHNFEGKQLIKDFIPDVMIGLEFLWGNQIQLETTEIFIKKKATDQQKAVMGYKKVLYTMKNKIITKNEIKD